LGAECKKKIKRMHGERTKRANTTYCGDLLG
jgi:hypothetical protein